MSLTLYKPNQQNKGSLFSIKFAAKLNKKEDDFKPGGFFINIVKQVSWDDKNHTGRFSGGESINFKLDQFEAAKILHVIERNHNLGDISSWSRDDLKSYGFYNMHSTGQTVHINFNPWQRKGDKEQTGFAMYVTKVDGDNKTSFGAAFPFGDDLALREYIKLGLEHINMAGYAEDKRRFEEGTKSNNGEEASEQPNQTKKRPTGRTRAPKATPEPEEEPETTPEADSDEEPLF